MQNRATYSKVHTRYYEVIGIKKRTGWQSTSSVGQKMGAAKCTSWKSWWGEGERGLKCTVYDARPGTGAVPGFYIKRASWQGSHRRRMGLEVQPDAGKKRAAER